MRLFSLLPFRSGSVSANANSNGSVGAGVGDNDYCYVYSDGNFQCAESEGAVEPPK